MSDLMIASEGAARVSEALLRANGGRSVLLRIASPASAGDSSEELGLVTAQFQDVEIGPAVFRRSESTARLLVSARAVEEAAGTMQASSGVAMLCGAVGVVVDGAIYAVERVTRAQAAGAVFCYAMTLRAPMA